jgi:hypothetical protein
MSVGDNIDFWPSTPTLHSPIFKPDRKLNTQMLLEGYDTQILQQDDTLDWRNSLIQQEEEMKSARGVE